MPLKRKNRVFRRHSTAVIVDLDSPLSALFQLHENLRGARIDGVFHQLLYRGRRTLHDLSGSNAIGGVFVQQSNST